MIRSDSPINEQHRYRQGNALKSSELAKALISHAAAYLPGDEELDMAAVRSTVVKLGKDPLGKVALDAELKRVNDPETVTLVRTLIHQVAVDIDAEAGANADSISAAVQPAQALSITVTAGTVIGFAAGTLAVSAALPIGLLAIGAFIGTSYYRKKVAGLEKALKREAALAKALL